MRLIVSIWSLRRSTRSFCSSQSRSATFVAVTDPKRAPVGPAFTSNRSSTPSDALRQRLRLVDRLRLVPCALRVAPLELLDEPRRRHRREPAGEEEVARVPARDVHYVAAQAELVDVLRENDVHGLLVAHVDGAEGELGARTATATWR